MSIEDGSEVTITYVGRTADGTVIDTTLTDDFESGTDVSVVDGDHEPLTFEVGRREVLSALEDVVREMDVGERRTVRLTPGEAYGGVHEDLIVQLDRDGVRDVAGEVPEPGMTIVTPEGTDGRVVDVDDEAVTVDFNHRLAGEDVEFEVELLDVDQS